jgi:creatinine amidohydrolase
MTNDERSVHWDQLTLEEVGEAAKAGAIVVLPVGATEQHGPHLATGTDSFFAETLAAAAAAETRSVTPTIGRGRSRLTLRRWPALSLR